MNNSNDMTDLSFTQTSRAMQSKPLIIIKGGYVPWWVAVGGHNKKPKVLIDRKRDGLRSDSTVFMGC